MTPCSVYTWHAAQQGQSVTYVDEVLTHRRRRLRLPGGDDLHAHSAAQQARISAAKDKIENIKSYKDEHVCGGQSSLPSLEGRGAPRQGIVQKMWSAVHILITCMVASLIE